MSELRYDEASGDWVIVAPSRALRPHDPVPCASAGRPSPSRVPDCPFCPGNEAMTPPELWRSTDAAGHWKQRLVPNLFPLLENHEVLIESPDHAWDLSTAGLDEVGDVLHAYRDRYRVLSEDRPALIAMFRNHGHAAGTSLPHPHSQFVALPVVPALTQRRLDVARRHFDSTGRCLYTDLLERELADGRRILTQGGQFVAYQPFAASVPYETWIAPRRQQASFGELEDEAVPALARMLRDVLAALQLRLEDPPYNLVVSSAPPADEGARYFVWHIRVLPRLTNPAGLELETGIAVNSSLPEDTASDLRNELNRREGMPPGGHS